MLATPSNEVKELVCNVIGVTLETLMEEDVPSKEDTLLVLVSVKVFVEEIVDVDSISDDGSVVDVNDFVENTVSEVTFEDDNWSDVKASYEDGTTVVNSLLSDAVSGEVLVIAEAVVLVAFFVDLTDDWLFEDEENTTAGDVREEDSFFAAVESLVPGDEIPLLLLSVAVVFDVVKSPVTRLEVDVELSAEVLPSTVLLLTVVELTLLASEFELFTR